MRPPKIVLLSLLMLLQYVIWGAWAITTGNYLLRTLQFSGVEVGLVYGSTAVAALISPFFIGLLADRFFSVEKILAVLHLCGAVSMFNAATSYSFWTFYICFLLFTICYIPTFSLSTSLCLRHLDNPMTDFPKVRVWGTIGWILVGVLVGTLKLENSATPMIISASCSIITGFFCLSLPSTPPSGQMGGGGLFGPETLALLRRKDFLVLMIGITLICIPTAFYYSFVNSFLNESGMQNAAGKMSLGQVSEIFIVLLLPLVVRTFGLKRVMFWGMLCWGLRYLCFLKPEWEALLYLGILAHGVSFTFTTIPAQLYIDQQAPRDLRSTAQGLMTFATQGIGSLFGTIIAGNVVEMHARGSLHNWDAIWLVPAAAGIAVALAFGKFFEPAPKLNPRS